MKEQLAIVNKVEQQILLRTVGEAEESRYKDQFLYKEADLWLSQVLYISWYRMRKSIIALAEAQRFIKDKDIYKVIKKPHQVSFLQKDNQMKQAVTVFAGYMLWQSALALDSANQIVDSLELENIRIEKKHAIYKQCQALDKQKHRIIEVAAKIERKIGSSDYRKHYLTICGVQLD